MQENVQLFSPIKRNILQFIDSIGISRREFYSITNISRGTLESKSGITEETMAKFIAAYPKISLEYLIMGRGPMMRDSILEKQEKIISLEDTIPITKHTREGGIPLIPESAMAGILTGELNIMEYECEHYIVPAFKDAEFLISVKGSSMYPKYSSGDIVACKKVPLKDIFFQWNKVYVLDTNQGALIKRVRPAKDDEHILIVSDNQSYPPFELHKSHINAIAIVIGVIRLE